MKKKSKIKKICIAFLSIYVCYILINQQIIMKNKDIELEKYKAELSKVTDKNQKLTDETSMSSTYRYLEKLAREKLGLIKQEETVVVQKKD